MIKIRLSKTGAKNSPSYRVVAIDSKKKNEGLYLEVLGQYDPVKKHGVIDKEKLKKWVNLGAQVSPTVKKLVDSK
ncbi:MAG: hypothetical protein US95_C0056G0002 [Candidatus Woesebacteria bacterium GW2011_GWB1_38_5]|uniref:Small ribosomal subunit protein bS16 n=4 Tax=Candidatus Woeseibacteriota TaxID=1752722 RepID=A0A0G0MI55_9BACT|nr:MAG: hypothetical protein US67_C0026G0015 [Candidatus Woesebacteria bacterium GW2011_GWD1_38_10]KKQ56976.1 MAG: hypothetical protein US75_C0001G0033 [Candidatus Woesebacteria bacterium GW2011_GWC1_38_13]KKQ73419.1 MAG: hypothetical protein US95_C0056G0002 [Candidatus Woesebacteria bacterium GW2011_GWB1_38_5]KKQ83567.1 MAG: hypothetical protein UT06_C0020G0030 [Candidatus Woesebacteria bacterium GW2011_GWA1_38_8]